LYTIALLLAQLLALIFAESLALPLSLLILCRFPLFDAAYFMNLRPLTVVVYDAGAYSHQNGPGGGVSNNPEVAIAR
jgi:hypothetical protein